ncbi:hypothetical protein B0I37DRAFT_102776 [Chaetomium sp. MPI-CAGE-AT-0009]|nr:hypothetical protein B0I37DRAFT_102776 [Chaetomium sp. MPI-CAGE-AT-0009]
MTGSSYHLLHVRSPRFRERVKPRYNYPAGRSRELFQASSYTIIFVGFATGNDFDCLSSRLETSFIHERPFPSWRMGSATLRLPHSTPAPREGLLGTTLFPRTDAHSLSRDPVTGAHWSTAISFREHTWAIIALTNCRIQLCSILTRKVWQCSHGRSLMHSSGRHWRAQTSAVLFPEKLHRQLPDE